MLVALIQSHHCLLVLDYVLVVVIAFQQKALEITPPSVHCGQNQNIKNKKCSNDKSNYFRNMKKSLARTQLGADDAFQPEHREDDSGESDTVAQPHPSNREGFLMMRGSPENLISA